MKKYHIIFIALMFTIILNACDQNTAEKTNNPQISNIPNNDNNIIGNDENSLDDAKKEYTYEEGRLQVSETFNAISEYDDCIYKMVQYSSSTEDASIDDIDFLLQQVNKYKERCERALSELENYNDTDIIECKKTLAVYLEKVIDYSEKLANSPPSENDDKYTYDDYKKNVYAYRELAREDVFYIWDAD